jgi:G3E family GTPase
MPAQMVDILRDMAQVMPLEIRPTVVLLDVARFDPMLPQKMPYFRGLAEAADVLAGNRCDLADEQRIEQFRQWAESLDPPKLRILTTHHGLIPDDVFKLRVECGGAASSSPIGLPPDASDGHHHHHDADADRAGGMTWEPAVVFDFDAVEQAMRRLRRGGDGQPALERIKGIFHTPDGWYLIELASGRIESRRTDYRRDNRVDWIAESAFDENHAVAAFDACRAT